jgi:tetratricopeptide (TPR) repeat protein
MIPSALPTIWYLFSVSLNLNPPEVQNLVISGLEYAYIEQFDSAQMYFDVVIDSYPDNPAGYFFKAALLQLKMMDQSRFTDEEQYLQLTRQAIKLSETILHTEDDLWAEFYLGSSYTYRAVYEGLKNDYYETFKYGVKGGRILQGIIKRDSTFYDAYLGAGSFEYFWARAARYLPVLKLGGGNVNEALRKLHVAAEKSIYSNRTAQNSLVFILGEEKNYQLAHSLNKQLLTLYPDSKTFLWSKADLEYKEENYQDAIHTYRRLLGRYEAEENKNYSNIAQCKLFVGKCHLKLNEKDEAREALKGVVGLKPHADQYPLIKEYCREAYGLLSRIF